jgi:ribose transport system substrate-binding protein
MRSAPARFAVPLLIGLAIVAGCKKSDEGKIKVAFVTNNAHAFWNRAERGCQKAAKDFDVVVEFRRPAGGSPKEQQDICENLLAQGVRGIAVSPNDAANQVVFYNKIADQVPLVTQDSDLPAGSKRRCYLGTDNVGAGKAAGKMVKELLPDGGQIVVLVGSLDPQNAQDRRRGVLDELAGVDNVQGPKLGKYELLDTITDGSSSSECKKKVDDFLVKYNGDKSKLCFVGLWAYNPHMALQAVKAAGLANTVKIVGFDDDAETLLAIKEGTIHGTVAQQPFEFGVEAVRILTGLIKKDDSVLPPGGIKYIPHQVIKKADVDAYIEKMKQIDAPPAAA